MLTQKVTNLVFLNLKKIIFHHEASSMANEESDFFVAGCTSLLLVAELASNITNS